MTDRMIKKPKILSDEKLAETFNKLYGRIIYSAKSIMPSDRAIAEAQNDYCYKEMLGQLDEAKKDIWTKGYENGKSFATINMPNLIKEAECEERMRIVKWGIQPCLEHQTGGGVFTRRECPKCWQALQLEEG